uniref:GIY-YIG endonuclease n=1 Tax=Juglanconis juglandina TaxID=1940567 RepID=A0A291LJF4_9PEZI|nr:hypothetical protein [Juglanconis juglandina]
MFNLNTSRVINMPGDTSKKVFMYNADKTVLIFSSNSFKDLYLKFGVWHQAIINAIRTGSLYLGKYIITTVPILTAKSGNFSEEDIIAMLAEDRKNSILYLYNTDKSVLYFKGLKEDYLNLGIYASNNSVTKYIDSDLLYLGKYLLSTKEVSTASYLNMPIQELKAMLTNNKEAKGISGKAKRIELLNILDNNTLNFDSLSACVKYFKGLGYTTSSNTLMSRINSGVEYKGYIVKYAMDQTSIHSRAQCVSITEVETV